MKAKSRKTIALIIWWCEGSRPRRDYRWKNAFLYPIEVTNTNSQIIKIFVDFLRLDLQVGNEKLRGQLQIHEGDNQKEMEEHWSHILDIPLSQFNKTIVRKKGKKVGKTKGTFKVRVYNKKLCLLLQEMLERELNKISRGVAQMD